MTDKYVMLDLLVKYLESHKNTSNHIKLYKHHGTLSDPGNWG